jgi:protein-disulfide isomerase
MRRYLSLIAACLIALTAPVLADNFSPAQKTQIEKIVKDYLMTHPEVLRDMAAALDASDKKTADNARGQVMASNAKEIYHSSFDGIAGNPKGDVTIVEFMDYNCGWCRKGVVEMQSLVKSDPNVRVIMKEYPIFGEGSEYAAKAAMASAKQGKYWEFHQALFATQGKVTAEVTDQVAQEVGLDVAKMKADMADPAIEAQIQKTSQLAQSLQLTGTPAFVIDKKVYPGYIQLPEMQASLADVRAKGGCQLC